jgi:hypothetical protein
VIWNISVYLLISCFHVDSCWSGLVSQHCVTFQRWKGHVQLFSHLCKRCHKRKSYNIIFLSPNRDSIVGITAAPTSWTTEGLDIESR